MKYFSNKINYIAYDISFAFYINYFFNIGLSNDISFENGIPNYKGYHPIKVFGY